MNMVLMYFCYSRGCSVRFVPVMSNYSQLWFQISKLMRIKRLHFRFEKGGSESDSG